MAATHDLALFEDGGVDPASFRHRDHVEIAFAMLRRERFMDALPRFARGIRLMAIRAGRPEVYHETITTAFLSLIAERLDGAEDVDFSTFEGRNADLFDKGLVERLYDPGRLHSDVARRLFILPRSLGCD